MDYKDLMAPDNLKRNRRAALDLISRLVEEAMDSGNIPQPSSFGILGEDDPEGDPVYDWCQELLESLDENILFPTGQKD